MEYPNFCGASYVDISPAVDGERSMNLFPEVINLPGVKPKTKVILRRKPGHNLLQTVADSPGRGKFSVNGRDFAVAGGSFFELLTPTTSVLRGSFPPGVTPVQMDCNTVEICLLADGLGYIYNLATNAFAQISGQAGFPANAVSLASIDTYFLVLGANSNEFALSNQLAGLIWNGIDFGSSEEPDNAVAIKALHLYLWIFGMKEIVVFEDSGNPSFPFARVPGSQIEQGLASVDAVDLLDNTLFWLGANTNGACVAYRADGYLPTRISTHALETLWSTYRLDDVVTHAYQQNGHAFWVVTFPSEKRTWVYDVASSMWHDRGFWNVKTAQYETEISRFHSFCFGKHMVADYRNGNIYELSTKFPTDAGAAIRWIRAAPHLSQENKWIFYSYFEVDMAVGGGGVAGAEAFVQIRWSDDGGFNWCRPRQVSMGKVGEYMRRVKTNRCGRSRNRVFEISGSDPVEDLVINGANLGIEKGDE